MGCQVKISSHVYVPPGGDSRHEVCDFFYNGNDRCGEGPSEHLGWDGQPIPMQVKHPVTGGERVNATTVREYIHELNRMVILGVVQDDALVRFSRSNKEFTYNTRKPYVDEDGYLIIYDG